MVPISNYISTPTLNLVQGQTSQPSWCPEEGPFLLGHFLDSSSFCYICFLCILGQFLVSSFFLLLYLFFVYLGTISFLSSFYYICFSV